MSDPDLRELAVQAGIEPGYRDTWGREHEVSDATLRALLHALGFATSGPAAIRQSRERLHARAGLARTPRETATYAWRPATLTGDRRRWGLAVQLYALHTSHTWGIGDFSALAELVHGAASLGACAVGINPMHALFPARPEDASPYSPSSRHFVNPLYIDVAEVEDFGSCQSAQTRVRGAEFLARLRRVRAGEQILYGAVASLKYKFFTVLYHHFRRHILRSVTHLRTRAFRHFQERGGRDLRRFAVFHVLAEARPESDWHQWPAALRDPESSAVATFAAEHVEAVEFHQYLQWQADLQLEQVSDTARRCGMSLGLFTDLAVGADPAGAESWSTQEWLARDVTIGAPPDTLNLRGQDWGLPAPDPFAVHAAACAPFAEVWGRNMHCAGALRIDHILGLMRLYWIPADAPATEGAYVRYPWRELLGLLAATSQRHRCMVIGEDLGTVPEGLRGAMHDAGILAYRLLYFERDQDRFRAPCEYPVEALVATGTHDLPPLPMWWQGEDIELRSRLGLWPDADTRDAAVGERRRARGALVNALREQGLYAGGEPDHTPIEPIYAYLARTPCRLLMVQLEDVLGLHTQVNLPGTTHEHANWRRRLPCTVEAVLAHPRMNRIAAMLKDHGRSDR